MIDDFIIWIIHLNPKMVELTEQIQAKNKTILILELTEALIRDMIHNSEKVRSSVFRSDKQ